MILATALAAALLATRMGIYRPEALVVAVSHAKSPTLAPLKFALEDAKDIGLVMERVGYNVKSLENPTHDQVVNALKSENPSCLVFVGYRAAGSVGGLLTADGDETTGKNLVGAGDLRAWNLDRGFGQHLILSESVVVGDANVTPGVGALPPVARAESGLFSLELWKRPSLSDSTSDVGPGLALCRATSGIPSGSSLRDLFDRLDGEASALASRCGVSCAGDWSRQAFGDAIYPRSDFMVTPQGSHLTISAGSILGVQPGSTFKISQFSREGIPSRSLGLATVTEVRRRDCTASLASTNAVNIPEGGWLTAELVAASLPPSALTVTLDTDRISTNPRGKLLIRGLSARPELAFLRPPPPGTTPDLRLDFPRDDSGETINEDKIGLFAHGTGRLATIDIANGVAQDQLDAIAEGARQFGMWRAFDELQTPPGDYGVDLRIVPCEVAKGGRQFVRPIGRPEGAAVYTHPGSYFALQFRIRGKWDPYLSLVDLTPDKRFQVLWQDPHRNVVSTTGAPSRDWQYLKDPDSKETSVFRTTEPTGREVLKLIASEVPIDMQQLTAPKPDRLSRAMAIYRSAAHAPAPNIEVGARWACAQSTLIIREPTIAPPHVCLIDVGINHSPQSSLNLHYCVRDAQVMNEIFSHAWGPTTEFNLLLTDQNATRAKLLDSIVKTARKLQPDDLLIFTFSGAGIHSNGEGVPVIVPFDGNPNDVQSCLTLSDLKRALATCPAKNQLVILDTCYLAEGKTVDDLFSIVSNADSPTGGALLVGAEGETPDSVATISTRVAEALMDPRSDLDGDGFVSASELADSLGKPSQDGQPPAVAYFYGEDFPVAPRGNVIPSPERIRAMAFAPQGPTRSQNVSPEPPNQNELRHGNDYAVLIATDKYDDSNQWHQLANPSYDANALYKRLHEDYGFLGQPVLLGPTEQEIRNALFRYRDAADLSDDDQLFVYVGGHGVYDPDMNEGYVVLKGSRPIPPLDPKTGRQILSNDASLDSSYQSYLPFTKLAKMLVGLPFKHIMLVLDVCESGKIFVALNMKPPTEADGERPLSFQVSVQKKLAAAVRQLKQSSKIAFAACSKSEFDGDPGKGSEFALTILDRLKQEVEQYGAGKADGIVQLEDLELKVKPLDSNPQWGAILNMVTDMSPGFQFIDKRVKALMTTPARKGRP